MSTLPMPWRTPGWWPVDRCDPRARALADRHYSRQTVGARDFMGSGRTLVMLTDDELAVWGVILNFEPGTARLRWRCSIFRNEGPRLSSELIREATDKTIEIWRKRNACAPTIRLTTEIDAAATSARRSKRSQPGECFLRAGWEYLYTTNGAAKGRRDLVVLGAPLHTEART